MTETYASYAPGDWTVLARGGRYLLLEAAPGDEPVGRLWGVLETAANPTALLDAVVASVPDARFCLIAIEDDTIWAASGELTVLLDGRPLQLERHLTAIGLPAGGGMILATASSGAGPLQVPIEGGVVGASALVVVQVGTPAAQASTPEPEPTDASGPSEADLADSPLADIVPPLLPSEPPGQPLGQTPVEPSVEPEPGPVGPEPILAPPPRPNSRADVGLLPHNPEATETVLAGICLNGHLSAANGPGCRVCGSPMPPQTPRTIPRPTLGTLILQDGTTVDLDRGAILGRAPTIPDDTAERPHLVNLAAYGRDVSRQHAEVILDGWSVLVRDLGSTNGTRIRDTEGHATQLEPGVATPLPAGGAIEIADVTTIQFKTAS